MQRKCSTLLQATLQVKIDERYNERNCCSLLSCMTCHSADCYTGQMARKHGRKGYDAVIKEMNAAVVYEFSKYEII